MGFAPKSWIPVYEDNNACIEWSNNTIGGRRRERAKHIDIQKHFTHKEVQSGHLRLIRVETSKQLADFTKGLHPQPWATCVKAILGGKWENT
jgi:hypothetical protein